MVRPVQQRGLSWRVWGAILARSACPSAVVLTRSPCVNPQTIRQRLREWRLDGVDKAAPSQRRVDGTPWSAGLLPWIVAWRRTPQIALALDATREHSPHKVCWTGLHTSPEAGASRATAGPDYSRQNSSTSALIRRIRADPCSIPAFGAKPACAGWGGGMTQQRYVLGSLLQGRSVVRYTSARAHTICTESGKIPTLSAHLRRVCSIH